MDFPGFSPDLVAWTTRANMLKEFNKGLGTLAEFQAVARGRS